MIRKVDLKLRIGIILALVALSIAFIYPPEKKVNLGLDLKGGMYVLLKADTSYIPPDSVAKKDFSKKDLDILISEGIFVEDELDSKRVLWQVKDLGSLNQQLASIKDINRQKILDFWAKATAGKAPRAVNAAIEKIRNRIDAYGVKETSIQMQGNNSILVQVPGVVDREIIDALKEVGRLEFKLVDENRERLDKAIDGEVEEGYELKEFNDKPILLEKKASLMGSDLSEGFVGFDRMNLPDVKLRFTSEGKKKFARVTENNVGRNLAIVLDGVVKSAPMIREAISTGEAQITGNFSSEEARLIASILNSGALPVPLSIEEERSVGPLLGSDSITRGINSILLGAGLVVFFVLIYYFLGGLVAVACLILDILFILAGLRMFGGTLTLPGIAGMILTMGMAVDANVLIFERIREELKLAKPLSLAVKNGFNRAKRTIIDANVTTLIAALFLFLYGTGPIKGFATTLSLGIVASVFTAVFVGRTLFSFLLDSGLSKLNMLSLISSPKINFVKLRNFCIILSLILVVGGTAYFYSQKDSVYGVDFKGGQILEYKIDPPQDIEHVRTGLKEKGFDDLVIQEFKDISGGVIIKSKDDISSELKKTLQDQYDSVEELKVTTVGPAVGKILRERATLAILLSLIGILIYIVFRFKHFDFAFAAVIALFHDVLISLAFMTIFGYEVSLLTVTALLTIAGYSINDTIVIYDRIRELSPKMHKSSLKDIVNVAINSTLSRTLITSMTTLMVIASIFILGGEALKGFSFTLLVGVIAGTYSSIYIASPLVLMFRKTHLHHKKK
jgi:SecD/SecF fusion protein